MRIYGNKNRLGAGMGVWDIDFILTCVILLFMDKTDGIRRALLIAGSQTALAKMAGVSQAAVSKWLSGKNQPSLQAALNIQHFTHGAIQPRELCFTSRTEDAA